MKQTSIKFDKNYTLQNIRCKYIEIKIFENLENNMLLNIINYNKKYQKLMNIKLNDNKDEFLHLKIEIIPKENICGKFINPLTSPSAGAPALKY